MELNHGDLEEIEFRFLTEARIKENASVTITDIGQNKKNTVATFGLNSPLMGTVSIMNDCQFCGNGVSKCPNHMGMIELNYPVTNALFIKRVLFWLKLICVKCSKFRFDTDEAVSKGKDLKSYAGNDPRKKKNVIKCVNCEAPLDVINDSGKSFLAQKPYFEMINVATGSTYRLFLHEVENIFKKLPLEEFEKLQIDEEFHPSNLISNVISVMPPMNRMASTTGQYSDYFTTIYKTIISLNKKIEKNSKSEANIENISNLYDVYYSLVKNSSDKDKNLSEKISRKEGDMRKFGAPVVEKIGRSTIVNNGSIPLTSIGFSEKTAKTITRKIKVTEWNFEYCKQRMLNGPKIHPGANKLYKRIDGVERALAINDNLKHRLEIGDYLDIHVDNEQVVIWREPIMGAKNVNSHKIIVKPINAMELNETVCMPYNADFDGDEMNQKVMESRAAQVESSMILGFGNNIIGIQDGAVFAGHLLDASTGLLELSRSDVKINKFIAMQLMEGIDEFRWDWKKEIFTGRELISMILPTGLNYRATAKIYKSNPLYQKYMPVSDEDKYVIIENGILKQGVLDASSVKQGNPDNIYGSIAHKYSPEYAAKISFNMQLLGTSFGTIYKGETIRYDDFYVQNMETRKEIDEITQKTLDDMSSISNKLNNGTLVAPVNTSVLEHYEDIMLNLSSKNDRYLEPILKEFGKDKLNTNMKLLNAGIKGKMTNFDDHVGILNKATDRGTRIKHKLDVGRVSVNCPRFTTNPIYYGFNVNNLVKGISPMEMFPNSVNTRNNIVDKALDTSVGGTYFRKSVQSLGNALTDHKHSVNYNERIINHVFGETGFDPRRLQNAKYTPTFMDDATLIKTFGLRHPKYGSIQKLIDEDLNKIKIDRDNYRALQIHIEQKNRNILMTDLIKVSYKLSNSNFITVESVSEKELAKSLEMKNLFLDNMHLLYFSKNYTGIIPKEYIYACEYLKIYLRSELNVKFLSTISTDTLINILKDAKYMFQKSLIEAGKLIGINSAMSVSGKFQQASLDSHHAAKNTNTNKQYESIIYARHYEKDKFVQMYIPILPEYRTNDRFIDEIITSIEEVKFIYFVESYYILYEEDFEQKTSDLFESELKSIRQFNKAQELGLERHINKLNPYVIHFKLSKINIISKNVDIETIISVLKSEIKHDVYIVYNNENNDEVFVRIYFREKFDKDFIEKYAVESLGIIIQGIEGVFRATKEKYSYSTIDEKDGSVKKVVNEYFISTQGFNFKGMLLIDGIDVDNITINNVRATEEYFGLVESRNRICTEIRNISGITSGTHQSHYNMYADVMTSFGGKITSVEVAGVTERDPSNVLHQGNVSYAVNAITNSIGKENRMNEYANVITGKISETGTNYNITYINEDFIKDYSIDLEDEL